MWVGVLFRAAAGYSGRRVWEVQSGSVGGGQRSEQAQALWYVGPGKAEIRAEPVAPLRRGHVRVRAVASALSRGTERLVFAGRVPESEYERMRAPFMGGAFPFPVKYGYAMVGRVEEGPARRSKAASCFALYPHQTVFNLPARKYRAAARRLAAGARRARRQHGDGAQRHVGRPARAGRPHRGGRRRACSGCWSRGSAPGMPGTQVTVVDINPARAGIAASVRRRVRGAGCRARRAATS